VLAWRVQYLRSGIDYHRINIFTTTSSPPRFFSPLPPPFSPIFNQVFFAVHHHYLPLPLCSSFSRSLRRPHCNHCVCACHPYCVSLKSIPALNFTSSTQSFGSLSFYPFRLASLELHNEHGRVINSFRALSLRIRLFGEIQASR